MTRVVHCKKDPYDVYIGRGPCPLTGRRGIWGNPIKVGDIYNGITMGRGQTIDFYRQWLLGSGEGHDLQAHLPELRDKVLGCWCKPQACHGDVLVELVNELCPPLVIDSFHGVYRFLSNFHPSQVEFDGEWYDTVEHAYQAAKTFDPIQRTLIRLCMTPGGAKKRGRKVTLRPDWEVEKISIMADLLWRKFQDPILGKMLLDTGDAELVEGNDWGDVVWGVCRGEGENLLGQLLMWVRKRLREDEDYKA